MRLRYKLLKETPEAYPGAVFEETCDNGNQDFECVTSRKMKFGFKKDDIVYFRKVVLNQPKWFGKLYTVEVSGIELVKVKRFLKRS